MPSSDVSIYIKSNNSKIEVALAENKTHPKISFTKKDSRNPYKLLVIDLDSDLTSISHEVVEIYKQCREENSKLAVAILLKDKVDTERKHYFQNLLDGLGKGSPLHRLLFIKDLYTISPEPTTPLDNFLEKTIEENAITISQKGENTLYPLSLTDFVEALIKTLFLSNTEGAQFWILGDPLTDLELSYQIKRLTSSNNKPELEINAIAENNPELNTLLSLGNKTRAEINWQPGKDFIEELKEKISQRPDTEIEENKHQSKLNALQKIILWIYKPRQPKRSSLPTIKKITSGILKLSISILVIIFLITITSTAGSLYKLEKSVTTVLQGEAEKSLQNINQAKQLKEIGESLYSNFLPLGNLLFPQATERWFNVYSFIDYSIASLENVHKTYSLGESLLLSLNSQENKTNYADLSLGLNSNLSQIYENINQIIFLSHKGKLPELIEKKLLQSDAFKKLPNLESQVSQYIKTTSIIPSLLSGEKNINILVLLQNSYRLKPLGGSVEDYLLLTLNQGTLVSKQHYLGEELDSLYQKNSTPSAKASRFVSKPLPKITDILEEPDFQLASQNLSSYFEKSTKIQIDTIVAVNNKLFESILSEEKSQDLESLSSKMREASSSSIYRELSDGYLDKLFKHQISLYVIGNVISKTLDQNQVYFWTADQKIQTQISTQSFAGVVSRHNCSSSLDREDTCLSETSYLAESINENQTNIWSSRNLSHIIKLSADKIEHQYQVSYEFPKEAEGETYNTTLHLYLPPNSNLDQVLLNKLPASIKQTEKTIHHGLDHYQIPLTIIISENTQLQIKSTVYKTEQNSPLSYSITEYRQPGLSENGTDLTIMYPDNLRPSIVTSLFTQEPQQLKITLPPRTSSFGLVLVPQTQ